MPLALQFLVCHTMVHLDPTFEVKIRRDLTIPESSAIGLLYV